MNTIAPDCPRCGEPATVEWADIVTGGGEFVRRVPASWPRCDAPDCVDVNGRSVVPWPPAPGELTVEDRAWIEEQLRPTR